MSAPNPPGSPDFQPPGQPPPPPPPGPPGFPPGAGAGGSRWIPPGKGARGGGSLLLGLVVGVVVMVGGPLLSAALANLFPAGWAESTVLVLFVLPGLVYLIGSIILASRPATSRFGAGLLLAIGVVVLLGAGICFALLASWTP
ncbi:MAG: hypothetical protein IPL43_11395 [Micropruina sp.]|nr:hypothetical protein [Micropruina sp.]